MKIAKDETVIVEKWIFDGHKMFQDEQGKRLEWLINNHLIRIACHESGWLTLYQDPDDGRYWEKDYPNSELHGGGPKTLKTITAEEASIKYKFNS